MGFVLVTLLPLSHPGAAELRLDFVPHNTQNSQLLNSWHLCAKAEKLFLPTRAAVLLLLIICTGHWCARTSCWKCLLFSIADHLLCTAAENFQKQNKFWAEPTVLPITASVCEATVPHSPVYCKWVIAEVESSFRDALRLPLNARVQPLGCLVIL